MNCTSMCRSAEIGVNDLDRSDYPFCIPESDYVSAETLICGGGFDI